MNNSDLDPFDAVILMSFGGPEKEEDVLPFLQNVTRGRGIPDERLVEVGEHYYQFGGRSPINDQNRALVAALRNELDSRGINVPLLWGNRNWEPYLKDVVREHSLRTGARRYLAIDTSAYSSYSSCRQYREDFGRAASELADENILVSFDKIRQYYNHPGFAVAQLDCVKQAISSFRGQVGSLDSARHRILYVTHSIPSEMQENSERSTIGYRAQHEQLIDWIGAQLGEDGVLGSELVYCSRSGSPRVPWLEPDVNDRLRELADDGIRGVILVPMGFVSDHMEVKYDLDTEATATANALGLDLVRAGTVGTAPAFVAGLIELACERAALARGRAVQSPPAVVGTPLVPGSGACSLNCCEGSKVRKAAPVWQQPEAPNEFSPA